MSSWWLLLGIPALLGNAYRRDRVRLGGVAARRSLVQNGLVLALLYGIALVALLAFEERLIFLSRPRESAWVGSPGCSPVELTVPTRDGSSLKAWWCPREGAQWTVLFCHGSGGNLGLLDWLVPALQRAAPVNVLAFNYPGYGGSPGMPSEAGCYAAAEAAYDWLVATGRASPERLILMGHSLGSAVACDLASRRPHRALVLWCAFTSMRDCGQELFPIFPVKWLMRSNFDCLTTVSRYTRPLLIGHGDEDTLVPLRHADALFAACPSPCKVLHQVVGGTHVTLDPAFFAKFGEFVAALTSEQ